MGGKREGITSGYEAALLAVILTALKETSKDIPLDKLEA